MRRTAWLAGATLLASCYLSPNRHHGEDTSIGTAAGASDSDAGMRPALDPVACDDAATCPPQAPRCIDGACRPCMQHADCAAFADMPACGPQGVCVACAADALRLCGPLAPACDAVTSQCVQCTTDSHCTDPQRSTCNTQTHACEPCASNAQCAHVPGKNICSAGACVACTATAIEACRDTLVSGETLQYVCDSATRSCDLSRRAKSKRACGDCVSDLECADGHICVDTASGAGRRTCQQIASTTSLCQRPYGSDSSEPPATSIDGVRANVCTLDIATTCEAHRHFRNRRCGMPTSPGAEDDIKGTGSNAKCGVEGQDDGYCVWYERLRQHLCTTACRSNVADCPRDSTECLAQEHETGTRELCTL